MVLEPGTLVSNRYRIIEELGIGGMAIVYKATDEKLDRDVTFKVLKESFINDEDFVLRFVTEARAAAQLANNNIVNVYDVGNDGNIFYIVMEYIDGFTLKDLICSKAPFTDVEAAGIAIQIAQGLKHAHKHNIVHRDIKPENILITNVGGEGTVKVTDFGIAQAVNAATEPTNNMGSIYYFSPEQAKGEKVDIRSDIYSLGIVMFEMVTGKQPFEGENAVALAMQHLKSPLPDIKKINPNISDLLIAVIKRCTSKEPRNRYQSAEALINDLRRIIGLDDYVKTHSNVKHNNTEEATKVIDVDQKKLEEMAEAEERERAEQERIEKKREKNIILATIISGLALIVLISIGAFVVYDSTNGNNVKVPDFVGMQYTAAASKAEKKGFIVEFEPKYKEDTPAGEVMDQSIKEGERVERGTTITLTVSVGENAVLVPNIVGMTKSKAETELQDAGLEFGDVKYVPSSKPAGEILSQDPKADEMVALSSSVNVEVSQGDVDEEVKMPNLVNHTKEEAQKALEDIGLVAKFIEGYSDKIDEGKIIDQGIPADTTIGVGSTITLTVSKGKPNEVEDDTEIITSAPPVVDIDDGQSDENPDEMQEEDPNDQNNDTADENADSDNSNNNTNQNTQAQKKTVSISVNPDLNAETFNGGDDEVYNVKIVAKNSSGEKVVSSGSYSKSDFPFAVNTEESEQTEYKVYVNDALISSESK